MTATILLQDSMLKPSVFRSASEIQKQSLTCQYVINDQKKKSNTKVVDSIICQSEYEQPLVHTSVKYFSWPLSVFLCGHFRHLHLISAPL